MSAELYNGYVYFSPIGTVALELEPCNSIYRGDQVTTCDSQADQLLTFEHCGLRFDNEGDMHALIANCN